MLAIIGIGWKHVLPMPVLHAITSTISKGWTFLFDLLNIYLVNIKCNVLLLIINQQLII